MMSATLYKTTADTKSIDKISGAEIIAPAVDVKPYENVSMLNPVFVLAYNAAYLRANYIYISDFAKWYYITDMSVDTAGRIFIRCAIDVRQTFGVAFIHCPAIITRAESIGKPTLYPDSQLPVHPNKKNITSIIMPETSSSFTGDGDTCYLLTCIGGEPTE